MRLLQAKWPHERTRGESLSGTTQGPPLATCRRSDPRRNQDPARLCAMNVQTPPDPAGRFPKQPMPSPRTAPSCLPDMGPKDERTKNGFNLANFVIQSTVVPASLPRFKVSLINLAIAMAFMAAQCGRYLLGFPGSGAACAAAGASFSGLRSCGCGYTYHSGSFRALPPAPACGV